MYITLSYIYDLTLFCKAAFFIIQLLQYFKYVMMTKNTKMSLVCIDLN